LRKTALAITLICSRRGVIIGGKYFKDSTIGVIDKILSEVFYNLFVKMVRKS
jgi:hypothetical protein